MTIATATGSARPPTEAVDAAPPAQRGSGGFSRRRYHEIDLLRLVAAFGVLVFHFTFRASTTTPVMAHTGFHDPLGIAHYGNFGVPLFFVISGFVILNSAWSRTPSGFLTARLGRLYPAFWVACTLSAVVMAIEPTGRFTMSWEQWFGNLSMASETYSVDFVDGVYWTLTIELAFYLVMLTMVRVGLTTNRVIALCLGWLGLAAVDVVLPAPDWVSTLLVPYWAPYFVAGMLFALVARDRWRVKYAVPLVVAFGACLYRSLAYFGVQSDRYDVDYSPIVVGALVVLTFGIFAAVSSGVRVPGIPRVAFLAGLTYPLYLLHENIGYVLFEVLHGLGLNRWEVLPIVLTAVVGLAAAVHVVVENRCARPFATVLHRGWLTVRPVAVVRA